MYACVCVYVREKERESVCVCVYVCGRFEPMRFAFMAAAVPLDHGAFCSVSTSLSTVTSRLLVYLSHLRICLMLKNVGTSELIYF